MTQELANIGQIGTWLADEPELFVVYDLNAAWVAREVLAALPGVKRAVGLETSEERKTLDTARNLSRVLLQADASRRALLLAIGGGITTDLTGFTAGIYKRGIRYANFPTTLLGQVDAAIGGKTGVNLDGYKNMLGVFRMPEHTFLCADVLRTLPRRTFLSGVAELLKTFLLADGNAYAAVLSLLTDTKQGLSVPEGPQNDGPDTKQGLSVPEGPQNDGPATGALGKWVVRAARIKEAIVARDPYEQGERAKLNLGHTFGHAIEHEALRRGQDISHGEAVALGMVLAARLSESLGVAENGLAARLEADFSAIGLPTQCPYPLEALQEAMAKDKKAQSGGKVKFVLPVTPGEVIFQELNPYDLHFDTK